MANVFSNSRIIDFWRFENNLLAGKNGNDLTGVGSPSYESGSPLEGAYSLDLESSSNQYVYRNDADLSAGFPFKSGDTTKKISLAFNIKTESQSGASVNYLISKYKVSGNHRSIAVLLYNGYLYLTIGYNNGVSSESWQICAISNAVKYHIGFAYDGVAKTATARIYNYDTVTATTYQNNFTNEPSVFADPFVVGNRGDLDTAYDYDGLIDELIISDDLLSVDEFDQIRQGIFGAGFIGTAAGTASDIIGAASGIVAIEGAGAGVLTPVEGTVEGHHTSFIGTGVGNLPVVTGAAEGVVGAVHGTGAGIIPVVIGSTAGKVGFKGIAAGTLTPVIGSASGVLGVKGDGAGALPSITGDAEGKVGFKGTASATLSAVQGQATGTVGVSGITGTATGQTPALIGDASGKVGFKGTAAGIVSPVQGQSVGTQGVRGTGAGVLSSITGVVVGKVGFKGTGQGFCLPVVGAADGYVQVTGGGAVALPAILGTAVGIRGVKGAGVVILPSVTGRAAGIVREMPKFLRIKEIRAPTLNVSVSADQFLVGEITTSRLGIKEVGSDRIMIAKITTSRLIIKKAA